jgi:hypothetical protein
MQNNREDQTMTTAITEERLEQQNIDHEVRTIGRLMDMYPTDTWSWEESLVVKSALAEIALWRQKGTRLVQLEKAAADIAHRNHMRAVSIAEGQARRRAAAAPCELCDEDGHVLGRDGKQVLDWDGDELDCRHGRPVDLDGDEPDRLATR